MGGGNTRLGPFKRFTDTKGAKLELIFKQRDTKNERKASDVGCGSDEKV